MHERDGTRRRDERFIGLGYALEVRWAAEGCGAGRLTASFLADGGFELLVARGEVVFQGIHVWGQLGNFVKCDGEVEGDAEREDMNAPVDNGEEKDSAHELVVGDGVVKYRFPCHSRPFRRLRLAHERGKDVEWQERGICHRGEEHVA